ncbi:MAG TPA: XRE family transcriptional regulator [Kiloniellales bacterium]
MTLDAWLKENRLSEAAFGALISAKQQEVNQYRRGRRIPGPKRMAAITKTTNGAVTANDFYGEAAE